MKFSEKMWFQIILKVTKNQCSTISIKDIFFKKLQEGVKLTPPTFRQIRIKGNFSGLGNE